LKSVAKLVILGENKFLSNVEIVFNDTVKKESAENIGDDPKFEQNFDFQKN
jgi:hypothetical protein